jgi:hypothetical protein
VRFDVLVFGGSVVSWIVVDILMSQTPVAGQLASASYPFATAAMRLSRGT